ncbi:hypothetical protein ACFYY1_29900 [Streptomyces sp. NPDC001890]|uniref:hypothetical protein n=1 Tax=Streptomyces sp. NPDC001890 TaxID=3364620 RepID=UPI0036A5AA66
MASNAPLASSAELAAHDRAVLTDFLDRCTTAMSDQCGRNDAVLAILRDQLEATVTDETAPAPLALSWTGQVTAPGTQPGPTAVHLIDSTEGAYSLHLDDELREALGLLLIDPSDPDEVAAENDDYDEEDGPLLEDATADALFSYLVSESDEWKSGTAHQVHARSEPEGLDYLLVHGPLRPDENKALITAIRLLHPERFGPAI